MGRVRYSVAASLDGFIADPDGGYDWIVDDPAIDFDALFGDIGTILMGRATYELVQSQEGGMASLPQVPVYVFSRSLEPGDVPDAALVRSDAPEAVRRLRQEAEEELWLMGGGVLFASLAEAGVVDIVEVAIVPVLLGEGIPLLPVRLTVELTLERTERFPSGIVLNRYRVGREG